MKIIFRHKYKYKTFKTTVKQYKNYFFPKRKTIQKSMYTFFKIIIIIYLMWIKFIHRVNPYRGICF